MLTAGQIPRRKPRPAPGRRIVTTAEFITSEGQTTSAVLIVDEQPEILVLLSGILEKNGFRTLMARTASEALEIARRGCVPIDLMLCNAAIKGSLAPDLLTALREIRPGLRALWMSAFVDDGVIRIGLGEPMGAASGRDRGPMDQGLLAAVRAALIPPKTGAGAAN